VNVLRKIPAFSSHVPHLLFSRSPPNASSFRSDPEKPKRRLWKSDGAYGSHVPHFFFCFPNRFRSDPEKAKKKEGRACCQIENTPPEGTRGCSRLEVGKRKKRSGKAKEQEE
jgi:hypothetical protein